MKTLIIISCLFCFGCRHLHKMMDAVDGKKKNDSLMDAFKKVDSSLDRSNQHIDSSNKRLYDSLKKTHIAL
ncbi:MAG: hypothetical protein ABJA78_19090 [Ferruginibacter sp.]